MQDTDLVFHMDGLYSYAMVLSRNPDEAADLVQETYVHALRARERLRAGSNVKSWPFAILRNIWLNHRRQKRTGPAIVEVDAHESGADLAIEPSKGPDLLYVRKIEREQVREAIQQLRLDFREIIILREYEGLS